MYITQQYPFQIAIVTDKYIAQLASLFFALENISRIFDLVAYVPVPPLFVSAEVFTKN